MGLENPWPQKLNYEKNNHFDFNRNLIQHSKSL
jgi:hypothetical protein